jgi:hypothetical protein
MNRIAGRASDELRAVAFELGIGSYAGGLTLSRWATRVRSAGLVASARRANSGRVHSFGRFSPPMTLLLRP